jgi:error-prone DNA polymerase
VKSITAFAMFGFPEPHAASFALLAYASAWIRTCYPAEFSMLNNQPLGFYRYSTVVVRDSQRHGLRVLPVDINLSRAKCTVEAGNLRLGFCYVRGLRMETAGLIEQAQPYQHRRSERARAHQ